MSSFLPEYSSLSALTSTSRSRSIPRRLKFLATSTPMPQLTFCFWVVSAGGSWGCEMKG